MKFKRISMMVVACAVAALGLFGSVNPAAAQSIYASNAARSAMLGGRANDAAPMDTGGGATAPDTTATYTAIFGQVQTSTVALIAGVGALAYGVYLLGLGYGVGWRLTGKSIKQIAK